MTQQVPLEAAQRQGAKQCRCPSEICACQVPSAYCRCNCFWTTPDRCPDCGPILRSPDEDLRYKPQRISGPKLPLVEDDLPRIPREEPEFSPPEWNDLGARGKTAKLLWEKGFKSKAKRYASCRRMARRLVCRRGHKYYARHHCGLRFCENCGSLLFARLYGRYAPRLRKFLGGRMHPERWVLARVTLSKRASGEVPTAEDVKKFNQEIYQVFGPEDCGVLYVDEFGSEEHGRTVDRKAGGLNLHAHGLYYGPYIVWEKWKKRWLEITGGEGQNFYITTIKGWRRDPGKAVRQALRHMLKYVAKVPAVSPERVAALEIAFTRVRRVHPLGLFYKLASSEEEEEEDGGRTGCVCPDCGEEFLYVPWRLFLVEELEYEGCQDLAAARRRRIIGAEVRGP